MQTVPGKGWNVLFRLYGPLQPWFDKTWKPGEFELVNVGERELIGDGECLRGGKARSQTASGR